MAFMRTFLLAMGLVLASANQCADGSAETCSEQGSSMVQRAIATKATKADPDESETAGEPDERSEASEAGGSDDSKESEPWHSAELSEALSEALKDALVHAKVDLQHEELDLMSAKQKLQDAEKAICDFADCEVGEDHGWVERAFKSVKGAVNGIIGWGTRLLGGEAEEDRLKKEWESAKASFDAEQADVVDFTQITEGLEKSLAKHFAESEAGIEGEDITYADVVAYLTNVREAIAKHEASKVTMMQNFKESERLHDEAHTAVLKAHEDHKAKTLTDIAEAESDIEDKTTEKQDKFDKLKSDLAKIVEDHQAKLDATSLLLSKNQQVVERVKREKDLKAAEEDTLMAKGATLTEAKANMSALLAAAKKTLEDETTAGEAEIEELEKELKRELEELKKQLEEESKNKQGEIEAAEADRKKTAEDHAIAVTNVQSQIKNFGEELERVNGIADALMAEFCKKHTKIADFKGCSETTSSPSQ